MGAQMCGDDATRTPGARAARGNVFFNRRERVEIRSFLGNMTHTKFPKTPYWSYIAHSTKKG